MRLINADRLLEDKRIEKYYHLKNGDIAIPLIDIKHAPTIEERKKGKWIPQNHNKTNGMVSTAVYYYPKCSACGHCANYTNFCPNCGADMRGTDE